MASCLENIIGIKANCDGSDTESLSGYFVTDYPGITIQSAANYNDEKTITGFNYLVDLRRRAMLRLNNDVQAYIAANYRVIGIQSNLWRTGEYSATTIAEGVNGQRRGIVIYKQKPQCRSRSVGRIDWLPSPPYARPLHRPFKRCRTGSPEGR